MNIHIYRECLRILGLPETATDQDIKLAYRRMAMVYHPDRVSGNQLASDQVFKELKAAYEYVSDTSNRAQYVNQMHQFTNGAHAVIREVTVSLEDAHRGNAVRLDSHTSLCLPKGIRSGAKIHANGQIYRIVIRPHDRFRRSEDDLLIDISISAIEAILGADVIIALLDNTQVRCSVPAGIQPGQVIRVEGVGMRNPESDITGDLLIRVGVFIPTDLSVSQLDTIRHMGARPVIQV